LFNKFFPCSTQKSERHEWIFASEELKKGNAVDRAVCGEYNRGKILDQPPFVMGERANIFSQIFALDEGCHLVNKGGWDE
jgi:hypothetical protein